MVTLSCWCTALPCPCHGTSMPLPTMIFCNDLLSLLDSWAALAQRLMTPGPVAGKTAWPVPVPGGLLSATCRGKVTVPECPYRAKNYEKHCFSLLFALSKSFLKAGKRCKNVLQKAATRCENRQKVTVFAKTCEKFDSCQ